MNRPSRESRVRRALDRMGYRLRITPPRHWLRKYYGSGYQVVDPSTSVIVFGCRQREYEATLEEVEIWAEERLREKRLSLRVERRRAKRPATPR